MQCNDCHGAHVEYDPKDPTNTKGTNVYLIRRNVKKGGMPSSIYFRYTGSQREYANHEGTGVCQGCHNVPEAGGKYPPEHDSHKASDCNKCHFHSSQAGSFSGSCGQCHGMPPASSTPGAGGIATPATGALGGSAGAHVAHVNSVLKMECNTCHAGYAARVMPNNTIDIGFEINGVNIPGFTNVLNAGGTYNNTNTLSNGYVFTGAVGSGANQTCNSIYCHGSTLTGGSNSSPSWVSGASQVQCGTCHGASSLNPPTAGSHTRHAGAGAGQLQIPCASCHGLHTDNKHVNGNVSWNLTALNGQYKTPSGRFYTMSGSTDRLAPSARYGTCTNLYCHSNGGPNGAAIVYNAVTWGGSALGCGSCHANMASSAATNGGHFKHSSTGNAGGPAFDCSVCHSGYTATSANGATHANKFVELISAITGYSKASPMAASGTWGTCSASQCHGQATGLVWNNGLIHQTGGDRCSTCHSSTTGVTTGTPFYSTEFPTKMILTNNAKVGAHTYHMTNSNLMNRAFVCADCHGPVALKDATHMNGSTNFAWSTFTIFSTTDMKRKVSPSYNQIAGTCANYCHGSELKFGDTTGTHRNPSWNAPFMPATLTLPAACNGCHGFPPSLAVSNHPNVPATLASCKSCHDNVNSAATGYADVFVNKAFHIDGILQGGGCNGCHGYPPANKRFVPGPNNWASAAMENYTGGGGAHTVAAHVSPTANPDDGWVNCTKCHTEADHAMSPVVFLPSTNIKVNMDQKNKFNLANTVKYEMNKTDGAAHTPGSCSNVSCHMQKTPKW